MSSEDQQALRLRLVYLMRRFLFLALGIGMLLPTAVNAEKCPQARGSSNMLSPCVCGSNQEHPAGCFGGKNLKKNQICVYDDQCRSNMCLGNNYGLKNGRCE